MPEGEGGEARGRLSCSRVIPLWWLKDPMVLSHSCSELLGAGRQHIRHQSSGQLDSCSRGGRDQSRPRLEPAAFGCGIESRKAHALAERRGSRGARVCEMRQQTTDDRRLSAVRLNDRRRNRHRRHFDEQRERARRRPAVAGPAQPRQVLVRGPKNYPISNTSSDLRSVRSRSTLVSVQTPCVST